MNGLRFIISLTLALALVPVGLGAVSAQSPVQLRTAALMAAVT